MLIAVIQLSGVRNVGATPYLLQLFLFLLFAGLGTATALVARKRHDVARGGFFVFAAMIALIFPWLTRAGEWAPVAASANNKATSLARTSRPLTR